MTTEPHSDAEQQLRTFAKLVESMRLAQQEYFRTCNNAALQQSKRREKQVDEAIQELLANPNSRLF